MDNPASLLDGLSYGFAVSLAPANLLACFFGVLVGTLVGVLPGIGTVGAMALLFPMSYNLNPAGAIHDRVRRPGIEAVCPLPESNAHSGIPAIRRPRAKRSIASASRITPSSKSRK